MCSRAGRHLYILAPTAALDTGGFSCSISHLAPSVRSTPPARWRAPLTPFARRIGLVANFVDQRFHTGLRDGDRRSLVRDYTCFILPATLSQIKRWERVARWADVFPITLGFFLVRHSVDLRSFRITTTQRRNIVVFLDTSLENLFLYVCSNLNRHKNIIYASIWDKIKKSGWDHQNVKTPHSSFLGYFRQELILYVCSDLNRHKNIKCGNIWDKIKKRPYNIWINESIKRKSGNRFKINKIFTEMNKMN